MIRKLSKSILMMGALAIIMAGCSGAGTQEEEAAPEETYSFVEGHAPVWENAIEQVVAIAEAMPEEAYGWSPHDSVRTFAGQLMHIAGSSKVIANYFLNDIQPEGPPADPDVSGMSKADIIAAVRSNLTEVGDIFKTMSDQQLMEMCGNPTFAGNQMTRIEGMIFVHDHLTNHKAKANLYIRIHGEEPPSYGYY